MFWEEERILLFIIRRFIHHSLGVGKWSLPRDHSSNALPTLAQSLPPIFGVMLPNKCCVPCLIPGKSPFPLTTASEVQENLLNDTLEVTTGIKAKGITARHKKGPKNLVFIGARARWRAVIIRAGRKPATVTRKRDTLTLITRLNIRRLRSHGMVSS